MFCRAVFTKWVFTVVLVENIDFLNNISNVHTFANDLN